MIPRLHALALTLLCACPIPIPRDTLTRPAIDFLVHDAAGTPIPNARILLLTGTAPHNQTEGIDETTTDAEGRASFTERIENITQFPLMMHGVAFYYWSWCVETPHPIETTSAVTGGIAPQVDVAITSEAEGRRCVERFGRMFADRNPPRAGLRVHLALDATATRSLEDLATSTRYELGRHANQAPETFAFDVRVESEKVVVDLGGLGAQEQQQVVDSITKPSDVELLSSATFGG